MDLSQISYLEWIGVVLNLGYLFLLIARSVWCWPFGILGSGVSILLFINGQLYSEAILYVFYVIIGIYGWTRWSKVSDSHQQVDPVTWKLSKHLWSIGAATLLSLGLGWFFTTYTDAQRPYADAFSTGYAFVASYLEAQQVLLGWLYWIAINGFSIWLYADRGFGLYSLLAVIYTIMSVYGLFAWKKRAVQLQDS